MTRPRTGQRKLGTEPVRSAVADACLGSGLSVAGVARRAVATGWTEATCFGFTVSALAAGAAAAWCVATGAVLIWAWRTPGMVRRWPTRTAERASIWLARASSPRDLP